MTPTPRIVVLSAPSGGGKTTIAKALRARYPDRFGFSVSATTRKPRAAEQDGVDYRFWKPSQFLAGVKDGQFLEHAQYGGELYGTLRSDVQKILESGRHVLLDIEVNGASQVRRLDSEALTIFILPSDPRVLVQRLVERRSESSEEIQRRLERAIEEISDARLFHRWIRNDDLDEAVESVKRAADEHPARFARDPKDIPWLKRYLVDLQSERQRPLR
ncbi:MAG: guanylate kinase [Gemmatimonadetes bacterium]|nr:MAG: guanylate kinase [Gemmatimonadota bacterium]